MRVISFRLDKESEVTYDKMHEAGFNVSMMIRRFFKEQGKFWVEKVAKVEDNDR